MLTAAAVQQGVAALGALALRAALTPVAERFGSMGLPLPMPTRILLSGVPVAVLLILAATLLALRSKRAWIASMYVTMVVEAIFCAVLGLLLVAATLPHLMLPG